MKTKLALAALAALCFAFPASATDPIITGLTASVYALPSSYAGVCPGTVSLVGDINVQGQFNPGQRFRVAYQVRNPDTGLTFHAAPAPLDIAMFTGPGTQTVRFSVPVAPNSTGFSRWELVAWQIDVHDASVRPLRTTAAVTIPMTCRPVDVGMSPQNITGPIQHLAIRATLYVSQQNYVGPCPHTFTFPGLITVTGPVPAPLSLGYAFRRSNGMEGPPAFVTVNGPGNTPVTDTWILTESNHSWEQLRVWLTNGLDTAVLSPQANFSLLCR